MKLSEIKNEQALDVLADLIEPAAEILADKEVSKYASSGQKMLAIKNAIKNHKKAVITVLATLDGVPVSEYECNVLTLPVKLIELLNDEDLMSFFSSQEQKKAADAFGTVTGNIKEIATE